ncbi:MAG: sigma-70 family RNA polymerase sigma factor [Polyangiaceae bacterium]
MTEAPGAGEQSESGAIPAPTVLVAASSSEVTREALHRKVQTLVHEYMDFVWRSLRRLGVAEADCDDGCQRVWVVVARKVATIEADKARSFIFSVVVRVASEMRRSQRRHQHVELQEGVLDANAPDAQRLLELQRDRRALDAVLETLPWEQRTVFVLCELEGMTSFEIAALLGVSRGTVASRLRLAREAFVHGVQRQSTLRESVPVSESRKPLALRFRWFT